MNSPLRIAFVVRYFYPREGGAEKQAKRLGTLLSSKGVKVAVFTRHERGTRISENIDGIQVYRMGSPVNIPGFREVSWLFALSIELYKQRKNYDILHCFETQLAALLSVFWGRILKKVVISRVSSSGQSPGSIQNYWEKIPFGKVSLQYIQNQVSAMVAISTNIQRELENVGFSKSKIHFIPNGIDIPKPNFKVERQGVFTGIFVGNFKPPKRLDMLLQAWARVYRKIGRSKLWIVGDGKLRDNLERWVENKGLSEVVEFVGWVEDVFPYLCSSDVFILPSDYEGLSNALIEAMSVGIPPIAARISGNIDLIDHEVNGLLFDVNDLDQLTNAILHLVQDEALRKTLGRNARITIQENYSIEMVSQKHLSLYTELLLPKD